MVDAIAIDLPGFGDRASEGYADVRDVLDDLCKHLADLDLSRWVIVGHSMGGKFATLIAARAREGAAGLSGLVGVVLVAGSPPSPEPMDENRRAEMLRWFDDPAQLTEKAQKFIDDNTNDGLPEEARRQAIVDFVRTSPEAWKGWLAKGSREDWSAQAGVIALPCLIIAGEDDGDLREAAQRLKNAPHFRTVDSAVVPRAAHMIPQEQPDHLAELICKFCQTISATALPVQFVRLMASDRVSDRTRCAMLARHSGPGRTDGSVLSQAQLGVLAAVVARILPGASEPSDLARRLDAGLATGRGDGWRFADLPADVEAWALGLDTLAAAEPKFARLQGDVQDAILRAISTGDFDTQNEPSRLSANGMRLWFEDVASEAARLWMSLPATWAQIGYDGFATGDRGPLQGYQETAADVPEAWRLPLGSVR
ncbi:pimeloyl-ACP methyl ester carboxylesterase [Brevundimonas variabilis]|uniref:Pimeloyl-ACP methyl ester carboxylesterase n=1 Tax=Brevundimonas variabilis TaxID=74312 RepID=A0A7W9CLE7_9CAUL|nr:pimeloyl-ACP methyl ester carboxylesterase [Brevundimonas variabilis]